MPCCHCHLVYMCLQQLGTVRPEDVPDELVTAVAGALAGSQLMEVHSTGFQVRQGGQPVVFLLHVASAAMRLMQRGLCTIRAASPACGPQLHRRLRCRPPRRPFALFALKRLACSSINHFFCCCCFCCFPWLLSAGAPQDRAAVRKGGCARSRLSLAVRAALPHGRLAGPGGGLLPEGWRGAQRGAAAAPRAQQGLQGQRVCGGGQRRGGAAGE